MYEPRLGLAKAYWDKRDQGSTIHKDVAEVDAKLAAASGAIVSSETAKEVKEVRGRIVKLKERATKEDAVKERLKLFDASEASLIGSAVTFHLERELVPFLSSIILHAQGDKPCPAAPGWTISFLKGIIKPDATNNANHSVFRPWCAGNYKCLDAHQ